MASMLLVKFEQKSNNTVGISSVEIRFGDETTEVEDAYLVMFRQAVEHYSKYVRETTMDQSKGVVQ